jgi:radical SAM superfamily enzyme YgiQ (UPF0313 family)
MGFELFRINLVIPPSPWLISDTDLPFLGPLYLSAYLKQRGYAITVTDLSGVDLTDWWPKEHFDVWGITGTTPNFPQIKDIANRIKLIDPKTIVVAGGAHATMAPVHMLSRTAVDYCIMGPGEETFRRFLNFQQPADGMAFKGKNGIEIIVRNPDSEAYEIAPIPDYGAINFKKYLPSKTFRYLLGDVNEATVLTTLGCPWRCNFCGQHNMRPRVRHIPLEHVSANIDHLIKKYKVKLLYILDDTFGFHKSRFGDICNLLKSKNVAWHCLMRAELAQKSRLEVMKDSGCVGVVYGFESGSDKILTAMNKKCTADQNYIAAQNTIEAGLTVRGQMIVGFPGETNQTIKATGRFIKEFPEVVWGIHVFQPYPGSDVWNRPSHYRVKVNKNTDFSDWHTIGKPNVVTGDNRIKGWVEKLKQIAERSIEKV